MRSPNKLLKTMERLFKQSLTVVNKTALQTILNSA